MMNKSNDFSCMPLEFSTLYRLSGSTKPFTLCNEYDVHNFIKLSENLGRCLKACTTFQYSGTMIPQFKGEFTNNSRLVVLGYWFNYNDEVEVLEEYLIYEITSVIGSIGGTLGLFIGFSFLDLSTKLISIFKDNVLDINA